MDGARAGPRRRRAGTLMLASKNGRRATRLAMGVTTVMAAIALGSEADPTR